MSVYDLSVDYNGIDKSEVLNIHWWLKTIYKVILRLVKEVFIALLSFSRSAATECISPNYEHAWLDIILLI